MELVGIKVDKIKDFRDGDYYIVKKGEDTKVLLEAERREVVVDVSEFFESAEKWKWGIKTEKWHGVFLIGIGYKRGRLVLNVENVVIGIKKRGEEINISAVVFGKSEEEAIKNAQSFKLANRESIAFEMSNEYYEYPLKGDIGEILSSIDRKLEEIKEKSEEISATSDLILQHVKQIEEKLQVLPVLEERVKKIEEKIDSKQWIVDRGKDEDKVEVHFISEKGVYIDGEKVHINLLGKVFDYLRADTKSFLTFFGLPSSIYNEVDRKLQEEAKRKYLEGERYISWEEAELLAEKPVKRKENWRIVLEYKDRTFKKLINILRSKLRIKEERLEEIVSLAIEKAIKERREVVLFKDMLEIADEREKNQLKEIAKELSDVMRGGKKEYEMKGKAIVVADEEYEELLLYAITLEVERKGKRIEVRR